MTQKIDLKMGIIGAIAFLVITAIITFSAVTGNVAESSVKSGFGAALLETVSTSFDKSDSFTIAHGREVSGSVSLEYFSSDMDESARDKISSAIKNLSLNSFEFIMDDSVVVVKKVNQGGSPIVAVYEVPGDLSGGDVNSLQFIIVLLVAGLITMSGLFLFAGVDSNTEQRIFDKVRTMMGKIMNAAINIKANSTEISAATKQQGAISSEQSTSVAEITSTMEELSATAKQIADNAEWVLDFSSKSLDNAKKGSGAVDKVMKSMSAIKKDNESTLQEIIALGKKSKEITKVMEIINNIADQTKLIAFNAAIEASSAGEAGRRFGVVAVEIRRLADSVMESTGEIEKNIVEIQESVDRLVISSGEGSRGVADGMSNASSTVAILGDMLAGAQTTTDAAKQISLSTQQQNTASKQVVTALKEIAEGAKQSSAAISQIGSVIGKLTKEAEDLEGAVAEYNKQA